MGGMGVPNLLEQNFHWSVILYRRTMKTIVEGIMHCTYAKFHVDLMYGTDVMSPNLSKFGGFLDFSAEKVQYFR